MKVSWHSCRNENRIGKASKKSKHKDGEELATEVKAPITGTVWKIVTKVGDEIEEYDTVMILESMKMEIPVEAPVSGKIVEFKVQEESSVIEDDVVAIME